MIDRTIPRPSVTTLVIHHDQPVVLMGRRSGVGAFAHQLVFPGGVIDPEDARDTWHDSYTGGEGLDDAERTRRITGARELFEEAGIRVTDLSTLAPVSRWVTPEGFPARFDTWFYVCELPRGEVPVADAVELTSLEWVDPTAIVESFHRGDTKLLFPTVAHLSRLADFGAAWREWPNHPETSLDPIHAKATRNPGGGMTVTIPEDAGFTLTSVRNH